MHVRCTIGAMALLAYGAAIADVFAFDQTKYPDWKGQWVRIGAGTYDPTKKGGREQAPPLTPEYQAVSYTHLTLPTIYSV